MKRLSRTHRFACASVVTVVISAAVIDATSAATAATAAPKNPATQSVASLRAELRSGSLTADHLVRASCPARTRSCGLATVADRTPRRAGSGPSARTAVTQAVGTVSPVGYGPADLAHAYHLPAAGSGSTGTVAFLAFGADPTFVTDIAAYRRQFHLPACSHAPCSAQLSYDGAGAMPPTTDPALKNREEAESTSAAAQTAGILSGCPRCRILEVQLPLLDNSFAVTEAQIVKDEALGVQSAVRHGADAISVPDELITDASAQTRNASRALFQPGVAIVSGSAPSSGQTGEPHGSWPANLPWVTAVGSTSLYQRGRSATTYRELVDPDSGGGCEYDQPAAVGQPASISTLCHGHRTLADVAAVGDSSTGLAVYSSAGSDEGNAAGWFLAGGVASDFIAALYVRGGHLGQVVGPNTLYAAAATAFRDVTVGSVEGAPHVCSDHGIAQRLCQAGSGWDGPTGLGTPNGLKGF